MGHHNFAESCGAAVLNARACFCRVVIVDDTNSILPFLAISEVRPSMGRE